MNGLMSDARTWPVIWSLMKSSGFCSRQALKPYGTQCNSAPCKPQQRGGDKHTIDT